jgi:4-hydroxybenzoate polyprenyltransferase
MTAGTTPYPLVVGLDGTLLKTDSLWELLTHLLVRKPLTALLVPCWLLRGRAYFKAKVASYQPWQSLRAPINAPLVEYLRHQRALGRTIVLATAAHRSIAQAVASDLDLFSLVLATESTVNLEGSTKLHAIVRNVGPEFSYAGNSRADLVIWEQAQTAIVVGRSFRIVDRVSRLTPIERHFAGDRRDWRCWVKAVRVYQWLKNLLVFIPLLTSLTFMLPDKWVRSAVCFLVFSAVASGTYIVNDLLDLDHDRLHPTKQYRPLASGTIGIPEAAAVSLILVVSGVVIAGAISILLSLILLIYLVLTLSYSIVLKRHVVADVTALACLYTLRIIAGAFAIDVPVSEWLLAFSCLMFFGLAVLKRCTELAVLDPTDKLVAPGRDYRGADLRVLWPIGVASSVCAVVVFELFMESQSVPLSTRLPMSWTTSILLLYWLTRLWVKTSRGEMNDDPVVFAMRDRGSRIIVLAIVISFVFARLPRVF